MFEFQSWRGRGHVLPVYFFLKFLNNFILQLEQASLSMNNNFIPFVRKKYLHQGFKVIRLSRLHKLFVQLLLYQFFTNRIERTAFQRYYSTGRNRNGRAIRRSEYSNVELKVCYPERGEAIEIKFSRCRPRKFPWTNEARIRFAVSPFKRNSFPRVTRSFEGEAS